MARLRALKSQLPAFKTTIGYTPSDERERSRFRDKQSWRKWYKTARWRALRWSVLTRDLFTCQRCGIVEPNTSMLVANHKKPHRGNEGLFWDEGNVETACKPCHDGAIQREERRGVV